ncbi:MAG TPA: RNA polymerase sigma factor [Hyphomonadaceae bacterium]|nr:RNA polymerase sigma factor [Hyphomonadaceae bacterium]
MAAPKKVEAEYLALGEGELVALARRGSHDAFRAIMQRCNQRLFRTARAIVVNESEAEDVVQEAYVRAFSRLDTFRGEASILTWLTRITVNEARGRLRTRRDTVDIGSMNLAAGDPRVVAFPTQSDETPEASAARVQIRHLIEQAVDALPEGFREVFVLRDVEDCSIEETAAALDVRPETVKTRLHRARKMLREALDKKIGAGMKGAFPFLGARCLRMTDVVIARLEAGITDEPAL